MTRAAGPALCAWGAALILFAVAAGSSPWVAVTLGLWAMGTFGWGALMLRSREVRAPQAVVGAASAAILVVLALVRVGAAGIAPAAALIALHALIAVSAGVEARRRRRSDGTSARARKPALALAGTIAMALAVAVVTTPALDATQAGESAVPHGEWPGGHHGH